MVKHKPGGGAGIKDHRLPRQYEYVREKLERKTSIYEDTRCENIKKLNELNVFVNERVQYVCK